MNTSRLQTQRLLAKLLLVLVIGSVSRAVAQQSAPKDTLSKTTVSKTTIAPAVLDSVALAQSSWAYQMDHWILLGIYQQDSWIFEDVMWGAHRSAYPVFYAAIPAAWGTALVSGEGYPAAYRLTLSHVVAGETTALLKRAFGRFRPFIINAEVKSRSPWMTRNVVLKQKRYSFPSGHATSAFALATSLSLSFPKWYVIAPAMTWATAVAMSRPWLGVHYPTDVMAGAVVGTTVAVVAHLLRNVITPAFLKQNADDNAPKAPMVQMRILLP